MEYVPLESGYEETVVYCRDKVCTEVESGKLVLIVNPVDGFMTVTQEQEKLRYESKQRPSELSN